MKRILFTLIIICSFMLTGCTKAIELTDEQGELVAQYAAGILVRNSYYYTSKYPDAGMKTYVPAETETETSSETETATDVESETETEQAQIDPIDVTKPQESEPDRNEELSYAPKALGIEPVEIAYKSYKIVDEYPDDPEALFTIVPEPGYRFVVVLFNLHNPGDTAVTLDTIDNPTIFKATINNASVNNFATLLLNDVTALSDVTIDAGADYEGIVVFMVNESTADNIESFRLSYKYEDNSYSIQIK